MNVSIEVLLSYRIKAKFSVVINHFFISPITFNQSTPYFCISKKKTFPSRFRFLKDDYLKQINVKEIQLSKRDELI